MKGKKFDFPALSADVVSLREKGILNDEKVTLGGKGGGSTFIVFELSHIGKQCFKSIFNDDPVVPEKKRIVDHHASLEHGYLIKDSAKLFIEMGYKVFTELKDVTFKLENKQRKVFDFVAVDPSGKKMHIEVERGTHTKEDFFLAMDKIYQITNEFYFICPNNDIKDKKTKQMFFKWITESKGGINNVNLVLNMTTIEQLRKKQKNIWTTNHLPTPKK